MKGLVVWRRAVLALAALAGLFCVIAWSGPGRTDRRDGTQPLFEVGDLAPEFELPDGKGRQRKLSEVAGDNTILCFACGCSDCRALQSTLGVLVHQLGKNAPGVVSVTTMPPEQESSWLRDTGLPQTLLYESKGGSVMRTYRGHPCPRFYHLRHGRIVTWIGPSPTDEPSLETVRHLLAFQLGWRPPRAPGMPPEPPPGVVPTNGGRG